MFSVELLGGKGQCDYNWERRRRGQCDYYWEGEERGQSDLLGRRGISQTIIGNERTILQKSGVVLVWSSHKLHIMHIWYNVDLLYQYSFQG